MKSFKLLFLLGFFTISFKSNAQLLPLTNWHYIQIDDQKVKWGDFDEPEWLRYFGLDMGDLNNDGYSDILTGRNVYINPGNKMEADWKKLDFGKNLDGILIMNVDNDAYPDLIAQALPDLFWIEAANSSLSEWTFKKIAEIPPTSHVNSQGFEKGQIISGGKEVFVIASAGNIYCFEVPENPEKTPWKKALVGANTSDEGIGLGDLDGDGDLDIAAGRRPEGGEEPLIIVWFENPGKFTENWKVEEIGNSNHPIDRVEVADLDCDKINDIIISEERYPGKEPDSNLFWYRNPAKKGEKWIRNHVVTQYSMNNLDIADLDEDGDIDLVTNEHKGPGLETQIWENDGSGHFEKVIVDSGKESHLGSQLADLDNDGDLDIVSIGWDNYPFVHVWRNDAITKDKIKWVRFSSEQGNMEIPNKGNQQTASLVADLDNDGINDFVITERTEAPSVTWYKKNDSGWERHVVETAPLRIEAGSAYHDIDGDGDTDIVFAGESQSNEVWWWENPFPNFNDDTGWKRHSIKHSGENKHHDQLFGDFDGDGRQELVFWNQNAGTLFLAEIPDNPGKALEWKLKPIYTYSMDSEMDPLIGAENYPGWQSVNEHEGLTKADIDGDGLEDIIGGGRWFKYKEGVFVENIIDASYTFSRSAVGQFIEGGRPEVILVVGDGLGPMYLYEWHEYAENKKGTGTWKKTLIVKELDNGHTIDVIDFNKDGFQDIFSAEMRFGDGNPDSKIRILLGDGKGGFRDYWIATGYGVHEGKIADLDGDGDYDILAKPYTWNAPRIDVWINEGTE